MAIYEYTVVGLDYEHEVEWIEDPEDPPPRKPGIIYAPPDRQRLASTPFALVEQEFNERSREGWEMVNANVGHDLIDDDPDRWHIWADSLWRRPVTD